MFTNILLSYLFVSPLLSSGSNSNLTCYVCIGNNELRSKDKQNCMIPSKDLTSNETQCELCASTTKLILNNNNPYYQIKRECLSTEEAIGCSENKDETVEIKCVYDQEFGNEILLKLPCYVCAYSTSENDLTWYDKVYKYDPHCAFVSDKTPTKMCPTRCIESHRKVATPNGLEEFIVRGCEPKLNELIVPNHDGYYRQCTTKLCNKELPVITIFNPNSSNKQEINTSILLILYLFYL